MSPFWRRSQKSQSRSDEAGSNQAVDMHLEVDIIPVSDVERSKQFYERLGWRLDDDLAPGNDVRIVQFTPPGSGCSVTFGKGITTAAPGSAEAELVVSDIDAAHDELVGRGVDASAVWHGPPFPPESRLSGPDPEHASYGSFCSFNDPDGNTWVVQEVTTRLPGRIDTGPTEFASTADLASALRRAEAAHGEHEKRTGQRDENWSGWYASYMMAEQAGTELPSCSALGFPVIVARARRLSCSGPYEVHRHAPSPGKGLRLRPSAPRLGGLACEESPKRRVANTPAPDAPIGLG